MSLRIKYLQNGKSNTLEALAPGVAAVRFAQAGIYRVVDYADFRQLAEADNEELTVRTDAMCLAACNYAKMLNESKLPVMHYS